MADVPRSRCVVYRGARGERAGCSHEPGQGSSSQGLADPYRRRRTAEFPGSGGVLPPVRPGLRHGRQPSPPPDRGGPAVRLGRRLRRGFRPTPGGPHRGPGPGLPRRTSPLHPRHRCQRRGGVGAVLSQGVGRIGSMRWPSAARESGGAQLLRDLTGAAGCGSGRAAF